MFKGEEKAVLLERLRRDGIEEDQPSSIKHQVLEALLDWKIWLAWVGSHIMEGTLLTSEPQHHCLHWRRGECNLDHGISVRPPYQRPQCLTDLSDFFF